MSAQIIDGKALAAATKAEAAAEAAALKAKGIEPCLAVILVGENPASQVYVRGKVKDCGECGIKSLELRMPETTTQEELLAKIAELAADKTVNGILVQLPLPKQIDERAVIDAIPPEKDVDGFSPVNVGRMQTGQPCFLPCTPAGCIRMVESTGTKIDGKNAVVIGRSNIVGKPAALLLLAKNATVTVCHSHTANLKEICANADILVAAVGRAGFVTGDMVKPGAVVIDVGINRGADGKLHGESPARLPHRSGARTICFSKLPVSMAVSASCFLLFVLYHVGFLFASLVSLRNPTIIPEIFRCLHWNHVDFCAGLEYDSHMFETYVRGLLI